MSQKVQYQLLHNIVPNEGKLHNLQIMVTTVSMMKNYNDDCRALSSLWYPNKWWFSKAFVKVTLSSPDSESFSSPATSIFAWDSSGICRNLCKTNNMFICLFVCSLCFCLYGHDTQLASGGQNTLCGYPFSLPTVGSQASNKVLQAWILRTEVSGEFHLPYSQSSLGFCSGKILSFILGLWGGMRDHFIEMQKCK